MNTNYGRSSRLIRDSWSFRGATVICYIVLVVRAIYPIFVWTFYLLTAAMILVAVSSGHRRR